MNRHSRVHHASRFIHPLVYEILEFELAAINLAPGRGQCRTFLNVPNLAASDWSIEDLLGMTGRQRAGRELQEQGLYLDLPGNGVQLLSFPTLPDGILLAN